MYRQLDTSIYNPFHRDLYYTALVVKILSGAPNASQSRSFLLVVGTTSPTVAAHPREICQVLCLTAGEGLIIIIVVVRAREQPPGSNHGSKSSHERRAL